MSTARRWLAALAAAGFIVFLAPALLLALALLFVLADLASLFARRRRRGPDREVSKRAVSVVIPTWNGRKPLARNLPSVVEALSGNPEHEILVMENGSDDGSAEFLAREFPSVRVVELGSNLGFGRACNAGLTLARHDVAVLLNNDMRVEPDFLEPLIDGFRDPRVFAVTAQIRFADPSKRREETGLTAGRWHRGRIHLRHVADDRVDELFPTFYAGGGSSAYDRLKILELGGFDELLEPFYMEDVDLSYMAWKRGWLNFYAPASVVHHEHRGTIGKHYSEQSIQRVLQRNRLLFMWKNMHHWRLLLTHLGWLYADLWVSLLAGPSPARPGMASFLDAMRRSLRAAGRRTSARRLSVIPDMEALRRPLGGFFRDRYHRLQAKSEEDLNVLFVSPYPIEPPTHGGAVFMKLAVEGLAARCNLHLLCLTEGEEDERAHAEIAPACRSTEFVPHDPRRHRGAPLIWPHAAQSYWNPDLHWRIHRAILKHRIDIVQIEYAQLASYGERFHQVVCCLFEHDLHYQSVQRSILAGGPDALRHGYEYLRALRFELRMLPRFDAVQVCSREQRLALQGLLGESPPVLDNLRAAIDADSYPCPRNDREPDTILFVGNFRHPPNLGGLTFLREEVMPLVRERRPGARLVVVGADAPEWLAATLNDDGLEFLGAVPEIRRVLARYAVLAAPILSGSGIRVKILEAFACGIPVVSTTLGAEGLRAQEAGTAAIGDRPEAFALAVVRLLSNPPRAEAMARAARRAVERDWNGRRTVSRLLSHYGAALETKLLSRLARPLPLR